MPVEFAPDVAGAIALVVTRVLVPLVVVEFGLDLFRRSSR